MSPPAQGSRRFFCAILCCMCDEEPASGVISFFRWITSVSPGCTRSVGDSRSVLVNETVASVTVGFLRRTHVKREFQQSVLADPIARTL